MADDTGAAVRFRLQDHLDDAAVRQGFDEQDAVVEAAALVRRMREATGLSQAALATAIGTSQAHLSMLERGVGRHGPTFLMLRKIARACRQELRISLHPTPERLVPADRPAQRSPARGMRFKPLHDRVVIRRVAPAARTAAGIVIPDVAKEKPMEGEVVAVGPGLRNEQGELVPPDFHPGDRILFGKWSGTEVKLDGEELLIMKESDIMGVVAPAGRKTDAA